VNRDRTSRRVTATLCVLFAVLAALGLGRWTHDGSAWTYDELRVLDAEAGLIRAPALRLAGDTTALWRDAREPRRVYLVDFIYTRCPGICQVLGSEYLQMQAALAAEPAAVHLVSLSIDPAHDGPQALVAWALGRAGTATEGQDLLRALRVVVVLDGAGGFVHNGAIHLIDAQGRLLALFDYTRWSEALAAARRAAGSLV
jgi:protein SCO1